VKNKHRKDRLGNTRTVEMTLDPEFIRPGNAVRFAGEFAADDMVYHAQIRGGAPVKMMSSVSGERQTVMQPIVAIGVASSPDKAADNAIESFNAGFLVDALNRVPRKKTFNRDRARLKRAFFDSFLAE
jgi:hypothetical protein